jgi:hypothetical protein
MGDSAGKLLERMRNSPTGWGQTDFETLFKGFGFDWNEGKKHRIYFHKDYPNLQMGVPRHNSLKKWVAREAVKLIDKLLELLKKNEESHV